MFLIRFLFPEPTYCHDQKLGKKKKKKLGQALSFMATVSYSLDGVASSSGHFMQQPLVFGLHEPIWSGTRLTLEVNLHFTF